MANVAGMTGEIAGTLAIALLAVALFVWNRLPVEVVGLIVMTVLIVTGLVSLESGLAGFSNEATLTVALMLALSIGLLRTGVIGRLGLWAARTAGDGEVRLLAVILLIAVPASAVMNNTAVVAILVPVVLGVCAQSGVSASRVLMPLSFASQLGGTFTLIGTSTNLLVAGLALGLGIERIRLFDITPPALVLGLVGILYLLTIGRRLTPIRESPSDVIDRYELHDYLTGLRIETGSRLAGNSLAESRFGEKYGLHVVGIERDGRRLPAPGGWTVLREGDLLLVEGKVRDIAAVGEAEGLQIAEHAPALVAATDAQPGDDAEEARRVQLAELMVPPRSPLIGRSLREQGLRAQFGVSVLGLRRRGHSLHQEISNVRLTAGDMLLVQAEPDALRQLHEGRQLALLGAVDLPARRDRKMWLAVGIMVGVVALPALGVATIAISALMGVVAMILTGCLLPREIYEEMDWSVILLLATILPLGVAMQESGAAEWISTGILGLTAPLGTHGVLATFLVITTALTAVISNAAAAVVLTPMAIATAAALGVSPLPFIIAVMLGASNSFLTPIGYQTNLFVLGPGGYEFKDFLRVGGPLTVIIVLTATLVIPFFFPFDAP